MHEFDSYTRKVFQSAIFTLVVIVALWLFTPYKVFIQGLFLGVIISLFNGWLTYIKTKQLTDAALNPTDSRKPRGAGMVSRMFAAIFAVYLSIKFPTIFSLTGVFIGLFVTQLYALFHSFILFYIRR